MDYEATYKTVRQAMEKLNDWDHRPYYEQQHIAVTDVEEDDESGEGR